MRSIILSLVLAVSALGLFAYPSPAEAHPVPARVVHEHLDHGKYGHDRRPELRHDWRDIHHHHR
jgi:hypothetical protein